MLNLKTNTARLMRGMALGAALLGSGIGSAQAALLANVGGFAFYADGCSLGASDCSDLVATPSGAAGIIITRASGPLADFVTPPGQDLSFSLFIYPSATPITSLTATVTAGSGATFGMTLYAVEDAGPSTTGITGMLSGLTGTALATFTPVQAPYYLLGDFDLNATVGGPITSIYVSVANVPAPAALGLFLSGLLGLAGASRRRTALA